MSGDTAKELTAKIADAASQRREMRIELTRLVHARKLVDCDFVKLAQEVRREHFGKASSGEIQQLIDVAIKAKRKENSDLLKRIKLAERQIAELNVSITEYQKQIELLAFSEAAERRAAIINAEAAECSADAVSLLDDMIRKGWTVSFYLCELGTPTVRLRRNRCDPIIIDARSTAALIVNTHLRLLSDDRGG